MLKMTEDDWKKKLTPEQYSVCREKGTERAGTGKWLEHKGDGIYSCVACAHPLFDSLTKFESGTGWPSFWDSVSKENIRIQADHSFGTVREEILCSKCGSHLGHVFDDGPEPTGRRYCINSVALDFQDR